MNDVTLTQVADHIEQVASPELGARVLLDFHNVVVEIGATPNSTVSDLVLEIGESDFGGWTKAQKTHFADGGVFDQIYSH